MILPPPRSTRTATLFPYTTLFRSHQELLEEMAPIFEKETGIEVKLRNGKDFELANQIVAEGKSSPADVFLTENSPAMSLVESKGLFEPVDEETLALIPEQYRPASGAWTRPEDRRVGKERVSTGSSRWSPYH